MESNEIRSRWARVKWSGVKWGVISAIAILTACGQTEGGLTPLPIREVGKGVFVHQGEIALVGSDNVGDIANIGFIVGTESVAVIDAGGSRSVAERLLVAIRKQTALPVSWLILTHAHPDHALGASVFRSAGARVIGHSRLGSALAARFDSDLRALREQAGESAADGIELIAPDETVVTTKEIDLGGRMLRIEAHPTAHTNHDVSVYDEKTGILWLSDLLFIDHVPSLEGSILGWIDVMEHLRQRTEITAVVPGHGPARADWPRASDAQMSYLRDVIGQTRAALAEGQTMAEASRSVGRDQAGFWRLFEEFHTRNAIVAYAELEWE